MLSMGGLHYESLVDTLCTGRNNSPPIRTNRFLDVKGPKQSRNVDEERLIGHLFADAHPGVGKLEKLIMARAIRNTHRRPVPYVRCP